MRFHDAANFLFDLRRFRMKPGTEATAALLAELGDPHESVPVVQVAGSNGKGSTARMVERALREAGLDVGLYTSPHLDDVRERIRVDGRKIPERAVCAFVEAAEDYVNDRAAVGEAPTFFETLTAMAYWQFARADVDVAVVEVGIGGKHDATSVVDPIASAVTTVTLEHTAVLGDTIAEIARDKAHVAPTERPIVTGTTGDALDAVREQAGDAITVGFEADADVQVTYDGLANHAEAAVTVADEAGEIATRLPLPGAHQARNAGVAVTLARQVGDALGVGLTDEALARGLRAADWPGRFEVMGADPLVVLDGAHNPGACEAVRETLAAYDYEDLHLVVGAMHDKDHDGMAAALPSADRVYTCRPDTDRAEGQEVLARVYRERAPEIAVRSAVETAVDDAIAAAGPDDAVLVTGSLYTVSEARTRWTRHLTPKDVDDVADARGVLEGAHVTDAGVWRMRGKGVHRVVETRVQPRQAQYLKEELLSLGGECAISGLNDQDEEFLDVVLMGTLAQFRRLVEKLDGQPYGLGVVADRIRSGLSIGETERDGDYPWDDRTAVMGILNVTPDSFHDGGQFDATDAAVERAREMVANGADIVDVGGESTNPNVEATPPDVERERVVPVIEAIAGVDALISVDTRRAEVAAAALDAGADVINDVSGLADPEMRFVAAERDAPVVVMHSIEAPVDPSTEVEYDDVVGDAIDDLTERVLRAEKAGLDRSQIIVDPGLGFGKSPAEDFELLSRLSEFEAFDCPILVGHSHKSMFTRIGETAGDCLEATVAGSALAAARGADIVRVHDVAENVPAVRTADELQ
ncbi:MAG: dihydropteroate synthase [Halobacteriaceae archaeon]